MHATLLANNSQHYWMLHVLSVCTFCCMLLGVVAQSLKLVKLLSQQLLTFLLFCDRSSVVQQCWIHLHSSCNIVGAMHAHRHYVVIALLSAVSSTRMRPWLIFVIPCGSRSVFSKPSLRHSLSLLAHYTWSPKSYGLYHSHNALQVPTLLGVFTPLPTLLAQ